MLINFYVIQKHMFHNFVLLKIQYDKLVTVTNNFTNDATQINSNQLKQLIFDELIVYSEHFHQYFPCLTK